MKLKSPRSRLLGSIALGATTLVAIWQFYEFAMFRNAHGAFDLQGGVVHLWLSIGVALIACVMAFFFFSVFMRYDRNDELHITTPPSRKTIV